MVHDRTAVAHARAEIVPGDLMPDGLNVVLLECEGEAIWAIREGCPIEDVLSEYNRELEYLTVSGLWDQHWGGAYVPPQHQYAV